MLKRSPEERTGRQTSKRYKSNTKEQKKPYHLLVEEVTVQEVAVSRDRLYVSIVCSTKQSGSYNTVVYRINGEPISVVARIPHSHAASWSPKGTLAVIEGGPLSFGGRVGIYHHKDDFKQTRTLPMEVEYKAQSIAWSPECSFGRDILSVGYDDSTVRIFDVCDTSACNMLLTRTFSHYASFMKWSPSGEGLAIGLTEGGVYLMVFTRKCPAYAMREYDSRVRYICWSIDGDFASVDDENRMRMFDGNNVTEHARPKLDGVMKDSPLFGSRGGHIIAVSACEKKVLGIVVMAGEDEDAEGEQGCFAVATLDDDRVFTSIDMSRCGEWMVTGDSRGNVQVWATGGTHLPGKPIYTQKVMEGKVTHVKWTWSTRTYGQANLIVSVNDKVYILKAVIRSNAEQGCLDCAVKRERERRGEGK